MSSARRGGQEQLPGAAGLRAWARRHAFSFLSSLGSLTRQPIASSMTVIVLAVALTLPTALYVTLDNVERISQNWERLDTISAFLSEDVGESEAMRLASRLSNWSEIASVDPISPKTGLAELSGQLDLGDLGDRIEDNPLPWVLEIYPTSGADMAVLVHRVERESEIEMTVVDLQWLERLDAILEVINQLIVLLALLFAIGVAFITANTIRMDIQNRREEIEVMALVGATAGFVRRPFLYSGLWYGLLGGALAWLLIRTGLIVLSAPIARLSGSYQTEFQLHAPGPEVTAILILGSGLFGIIGSWLVVSQHLRRINPG